MNYVCEATKLIMPLSPYCGLHSQCKHSQGYISICGSLCSYLFIFNFAIPCVKNVIVVLPGCPCGSVSSSSFCHHLSKKAFRPHPNTNWLRLINNFKNQFANLPLIEEREESEAYLLYSTEQISSKKQTNRWVFFKYHCAFFKKEKKKSERA